MLARNGVQPPAFGTAGILVAIIIFSVIPYSSHIVSADASLAVELIPSAQEANPGESAEYTVRVYNQGSEAATVSLSATNDQDCTGYSSSIGQISGPIEGGSYEETTLTVTLSQNAEGSCNTLVTATGNEQSSPPPPGTAEATATTTAGDGSGSAVFGVDITMDAPVEQTWDGTEEQMTWTAVVENTGQTESTISIEVDESDESGCSSTIDFDDVDVDPSSVSLGANDTETITFTLDIPEGQEADRYCWEATATVQGGVTPGEDENVSDSDSFSLVVPPIHECESSLSKANLFANPDETVTTVVTFENLGNEPWSVSVDFQGVNAQEWASVDGPSSGQIPYDTSDDTISFTIELTPDDSVEANSETTITVRGKDGSSPKCDSEITLTVGQSYGGTMSLSTRAPPPVNPGESVEVQVTVVNNGNGPEVFRLTTSSPPVGWSATLSDSTISTSSRFSGSKEGTADLTVSLPDNALATDVVVITISMLSQDGGEVYATEDLEISVVATYGMIADVKLSEQEGRPGTEVMFPIEVTNTGNKEDLFQFSVIAHTQVANPWESYFQYNGQTLTSPYRISIPPSEQPVTVNLVVVIDENAERQQSDVLTVRVRNYNDPCTTENCDIEEFDITATMENKMLAVDLRLEDGGSDGLSGLAQLPPGETQTYVVWVENIGDTDTDMVFEINGLEGIATRQMYYQGSIFDGEINVPIGWGIWNISSGDFEQTPEGVPHTKSSKNKAQELMIELDLVSDNYEARPLQLKFELVLTVSEGAENGDGGLLEIYGIVTKNASNRDARLQISLSVQTIHSIELFTEDALSQEIILNKLRSSHSFDLMLTNSGNTDSDVRIFASEGLRGWTVVISPNGISDCETNNSELICTIERGTSLNLTIKARSPVDAVVSDTFLFTVSAEPVDTGLIGRQNIEFEVNGVIEESLLSSMVNTQTLAGIGGLVFLGLLYLFMRRK